MANLIRIKPPIDSNVEKVDIKRSPTKTGFYSQINGSPFTIKTNGIYILEIKDESGNPTDWYKAAWIDELGNTGSYSQPFQVIEPYCRPRDVWWYLNKFTRVRAESLGTGDGTTSIYELDNKNVIDGTYEIRYGSSYETSQELIEQTHYYIDLDNGRIKLSPSGVSLVNGSNLYADYDYAPIPETSVYEIIKNVDSQINKLIGRKFYKISNFVEYFDIEDTFNNVIFLSKTPVITVSSIEYNENDFGSTANWTSLTFGIGEDYYYTDEDLKIGKITFTGNKTFNKGKYRLKVTYDYGYEETPREITRLSILMTVKDLIVNPAFAASILSGMDTFNNLRPDYMLDAEIDKTIKALKSIRPRLV